MSQNPGVRISAPLTPDRIGERARFGPSAFSAPIGANLLARELNVREHDADEREARADRIRRAHLKAAHYAADRSEDVETMRDALALGTLTAQHGKVLA